MAPCEASALARVRDLESRARQVSTPCGAGTMRWRVWGEGRPLVLLHGGFGSWQHWVRNIEPLSRHVQVIAGDLPGLGDSDEAPQPHSPEMIADVLHAGLQKILPRGDRLSLAGFSLGAAFAAVLALRIGRQLDHLLLFAPSGMGAYWHNITRGLARWAPTANEAERRAVVRANLGVSMIADRKKIDTLAVTVQETLLRQKRRLKGLPISQSDTVLRALPAVSAPTTIVWGERDPYMHPDVQACADHIRTAHPRTDVRVLAGAGHWVVYEAHATVSALILEKLGAGGKEPDKNCINKD